MLETTNVILAAIGAAAVLTAIGTALSSHLLRWLAAHCLLQAGALESYHEYRRDHLDRHMEACGCHDDQVVARRALAATLRERLGRDDG